MLWNNFLGEEFQNQNSDPFFKFKKRCIQILFGNKEKYLNKFKTYCRVRPVEEQILGQEHYKKERTKLLRTCLITLHSNFEIFQKGNPAVEVMLDRRIFER